MTPFLGKLLAGVAVVFAALSLGFWLGGRDGAPGAEAKPASPVVTLADDRQQPKSSRSSRSSGRSVPSAASETGPTVAVSRIVDGDTLDLADGTRVRLLQIDTPELRGSECYADEASAQLAALLPPGTEVRIETDPNLDKVDRYGRDLGYVIKGTENINVTLVRQGAASVWFYGGTRGTYASELEAAASEAHAAGRGLWGACAGTVFVSLVQHTFAIWGFVSIGASPLAVGFGSGCRSPGRASAGGEQAVLVPVGLTDAEDVAGRFERRGVCRLVGRVTDDEQHVNDWLRREPGHGGRAERARSGARARRAPREIRSASRSNSRGHCGS